MSFELRGSDRREHSQEFPSDLFERHEVVALAESAHGRHDETILRFLDKFIEKIKAVFIELPVNYQQSVDEYLINGQADEALERLFAGAEKEGKNIRGLLGVLDKIKTAQKSVICFDSSKIPQEEYRKPSNYGKYFLRGRSRDEDMFTVIQEYRQKNPGKYLLIVGANHSALGQHPQSGDATLGQRLHEAYNEEFAEIVME